MTTPLTQAERKTLRQIAQAATPGQWTAHEGDLEGKTASEYARTLFANREEDGTTTGRLFLTQADNDIDPELGDRVVPALTGDGPRSEANAVHIAAFSPATALALLNDLDRLDARLAALTAVHWRYFDEDGDPGYDDTTPEPEDVWRYDRDFRAALAAPAAPTHEEDHR